MYWELWDTESKNLVDTFDSENEAIQAVREILAVNRSGYVDALALTAAIDEHEARDTELPSVLQGSSLRARLDEETLSASVDDDTRAVHEKIRRWLADEGWQVQNMPKPGWTLNIVVTVDGGQTVDVFQHEKSLGRITIAQAWTFDDSSRSDFSKLPDTVQRDVIHTIYRDVLTSGLDLARLDASLTEMRYGSFIYFDGLTKDSLMQRILLVVRMHHLTMRTFGRAFAEVAGRQDNITLLRAPQAAAG